METVLGSSSKLVWIFCRRRRLPKLHLRQPLCWTHLPRNNTLHSPSKLNTTVCKHHLQGQRPVVLARAPAMSTPGQAGMVGAIAATGESQLPGEGPG